MATKKYLDLTGLTYFKGKLDTIYPVLENGEIPSHYLPSYVDDVLEFGCRDANERLFPDSTEAPDASATKFPTTGESGKIYVSLFTGKCYRWSGTQYTEISASLTLGETAHTAYEGSKGKKNADDIAQLKIDLAKETSDRETEDGKLQTQITNITTGNGSMGARLTAVEAKAAANETAITTEASTRQTNDEALGARIDAVEAVNATQTTNIAKNADDIAAETTAREGAIQTVTDGYQAADAAQTTAITNAYTAADTAITTAYTAADTALQGQIDDIIRIQETEIDAMFTTGTQNQGS